MYIFYMYTLCACALLVIIFVAFRYYYYYLFYYDFCASFCRLRFACGISFCRSDLVVVCAYLYLYVICYF